jgi:hypothetical protein
MIVTQIVLKRNENSMNPGLNAGQDAGWIGSGTNHI